MMRQRHLTKKMAGVALAFAVGAFGGQALAATDMEPSPAVDIIGSGEISPSDALERHPVFQNYDRTMASSLFGATVYSEDLKPVGTVVDIVIGLEGRVESLLIGSEQELGLGEKQIKVDLQHLEVKREPGGNVYLLMTFDDNTSGNPQDTGSGDAVSSEPR